MPKGSEMLGFIALMAIYAVNSVAGMVMIKLWLPNVQAAWTSGQSMVRPGLMLSLGAGLYVLSFLTWMIIIARSPLTVVYPIAVGVTMVLSTVSAILFLNENLSLTAVLGMFLVFSGVVLLCR